MYVLGTKFRQKFISSRDGSTCKRNRNKEEMKTCKITLLRNDGEKEKTTRLLYPAPKHENTQEDYLTIEQW